MPLETIIQPIDRGEIPFDPAEGTVRGGPVDLDGRRFYRIQAYDQMPPFFMTLVSASDVWLFISSTGGLTAGRVDADRALFPYYTDDKITESGGRTGGFSVLLVRRPDGTRIHWQPFAEVRPGDQAVQRTLYKDALGTTLVFEETRPDLGLRLRVTWQTSARFGVVRSCALTSLTDQQLTDQQLTGEQLGETLDVDLLDGLVNILPAGAHKKTQNELSVLLDAYKRAELDSSTGLGLLTLNATLSDLAEPSESLQANVVWQVGLGNAEHLLSISQVAAFARGRGITAETDVRGRRGAYLVHARITLPPGSTQRWQIVADVNQDAADVVALREKLRDPAGLAEELAADIAGTRSDLETILAATDAAQHSGDELATIHHTANVLFNTMRGGVPAEGYTVESSDVRAFIVQRSQPTAQRCAGVLAALPERLRADELIAIAQEHGDGDLWRLTTEYLPLTFSRRHGDPSRPWNQFRIVLKDESGIRRLEYQGNWRDIFQNWEALAWSFPEYVESMVTIFLDATTADGYNPYRISREGIDWEVPEPEDPWANIGYWSDHQIIYLLKLLETSRRFHPGRLDALINRADFTHADVPYRIAAYADILTDPYNTITFDDERQRAISRRVAAEGSDGRLVHGADGDLVRVTLAEKVLLLLLAKLVNLVPDGGIWMTTQRPEWNDANNALVGRGLSVVTLAYLRRYLVFVQDLLTVDVELSSELAGLLTAVRDVLCEHADALADGFDSTRRRTVMDGLGEAGTAYRERVYAGFGGARMTVAAGDVAELLDLARRFVESGLHANRRDDGLVHSYNVLELGPDGADVRRLAEMLEGQVAILSSGLLGPEESLVLLGALRTSRLYRADQHSYILYPDKDLSSFLARNTFSAERAADCPLTLRLTAAGDRSIVVRDVQGDLHFAAHIRNARGVSEELDRLSADPALQGAVEQDRAKLLTIFEEVFRHAEFTGRSGSFFAYEGLGSIYWHMVAKLLLAVQETLDRAVAEQADEAAIQGLIAAYEDVRAGIGYRKDPLTYGAFPTDPYSHTPAGQGARQPGMTGQVKEEVLTRLGELGLRVEDGRIRLRPTLLRAGEWTTAPGTFAYRDVFGEQHSVALPADTLAFTFCQVPVVFHRGGPLEVVAHLAGGSQVPGPGGALDPEVSASVFRRDGRVRSLTVTVPD
ncbi:hypothetical protein E3O53_05035 [Cryobacterium sp. TMT2-18-3]|uniref:hypothetical protein n=1 Tax=unclassified Cryobacterium TaxID=2649013 RepID=UPI001069F81D|nr:MULTISPECIES: hypothetical protein [unclassified Cryobacterium]TFC29686.1 hypothetical protein E3O22_05975 [Cryobacterium sp. TMT2-18-2]TFC65754.1 hypothetical protein E3O53_05035 [Cryobacterium sp. TMT2-18-3]